ncbi:MAG: Abi-alpha family protein, partial [Acidimicrobiales bacterium]
LRAVVRDVLGVEAASDPAHRNGRAVVTREELRARGAALLYKSADVWHEQDTHPAYARILDELTPDEARILRFLVIDGPQPSIDVRTNRPLGVGSEVVASGLSMIGLQAGVRSLERTNADLNNLFRLGLIWFSREQVSDPTRYQVVEVQPDVLVALKAAGRSPKIVHRSIHLTPFGDDFCAECLPLG